MREFQSDQGTDLAAALTYYAVLSLFPALLVMVSLLGVFGQGRSTTDALLDVAAEVAPASALDTLRPSIDQLVNSPAAGFALVAGIVGALWSASGYVGAFGRAMNRSYEIDEGRPVWKLRPVQLLLTSAGLVMAAAVLFMLAVSGPVARAIGGAIGLGDTALAIWNILRWPNVKQPRFRWMSVGAAVAIVVGSPRRRCSAAMCQLRQLQQDIWRIGGCHRVVDHEPGPAVRCGGRRRIGAKPSITGRPAGRA